MAKNWRNHEGYVRGMDGIYKIDPNLERDILKHINEFSEGAKRVDFLVRSDDADDMIIHHTISARRGKWKKLPSDCTDSKQE